MGDIARLLCLWLLLFANFVWVRMDVSVFAVCLGRGFDI
jgi:hypothetical protein